MYDMSYGGTFWVTGDHWSHLKNQKEPMILPNGEMMP
jgi:hypothetical protein